MAIIRPFNAIRPAGDRAEEIAALPYDVYNRAEAKEEVKDKPLSFLRIDRAEVNFPETVDMYSPEVYKKAGKLMWEAFDKGYFVQDEGPYYYIYELTMNGRVQTGIVALASIDDYEKGVVKRHEKTRQEKEEDRVRHVDTVNAQTGPIFLAYRSNPVINGIVNRVKSGEDLYDFTSPDGIRHRVFIIHEKSDIDVIRDTFGTINDIYIADGHHRCASAVRVGHMRRDRNPGYTGNEEFNFFLSVLFPDEELKILDYNRVVKTCNGKSNTEILREIGEVCSVVEIGEASHPEVKGSFTMFFDGKWYMCVFNDKIKNNDPVEGLDVSLLQRYVLTPVFGIGDPKTDPNIDFVGGIRGLKELERRVETDSKIAFAMYPTSIGELFTVADRDLLMPPKSTWFEPKLRSGLFIHRLDG